LIIATSIALAFHTFELVGLFTGISTFANAQSIISCLAHVSGSVVLILFHLESWPSYLFWYVFGFCAFLPFMTE
ncbi:hypothetical protein HELRODRAFT_147116, partial [Helobdella robusta]|uniref:Transmembrane protein 107 n=1 Tax=Helobdella robusta TaxID=6412 RepID=T1EJW9_HELRO